MRPLRPWRRFWIALLAVGLGNPIYPLVEGFLPEKGRHQPFRVDLGLAVDFWVCLVVFNLLLVILRSKH